MSLRKKVVFILLLVTGASVGLNYVAQRYTLLPSFVRLEREEAQKDLGRVVQALQGEINQLDQFCSDWAAWDDTYEFVEDINTDYITSNFVMATFTDNNINLIYVINLRGRVVWSRIYDLETEQPIQIQEFPEKIWAVTHPLLRHTDPKATMSGVVLTSRGPILLSSCPIVRSDYQGPIRGTMFMGRCLGDDLIETLAARTNVDLHVRPLPQGMIPAEQEEVLSQITPDEPYFFRARQDGVTEVYTTFPNIHGDPALLVRADVATDITVRGQAAMRFAMWSTLVVALVVLLVLIVFLRRTVIGPLSRLTGHVTSISRGSDLSLLLAMPSKDEIGTLAREFNAMVRRIQHDAAQRGQAEAALRESEARIRALLDTAPDGIITISDAGIIESFNPAAVQIFGYSKEEAVGREATTLVSEESEPAKGPGPILSGPWLTTADGAHEVLGRRKDGSTFAMHLTLSGMSLEERRVYTVIVRDITELTEMHERVLESEHLAMIGEMAASLAHEVRNPLAGISGAAQVLSNNRAGEESHRRAVHEILGQVERLEKTVRSFLMFSRPVRPEKRMCSLPDLVQDLCRSAKTQEPFAHVQFTFEGEPDIQVFVDPSLLHQVLWNLLHNAREAMPNGGEIRWRFAKTPTAVRAIMKDDGCGMTPEVQQKLFRPFFTAKAQGIGLGLAICGRIIEAHGGSITISSAPGEGAEVTIELPIGD